MLKVSGIYVSPAEVEAALVSHDAVLEAAVVGAEDENKLVKPKAYVVLKAGNPQNEALKARLQQHVKDSSRLTSTRAGSSSCRSCRRRRPARSRFKLR